MATRLDLESDVIAGAPTRSTIYWAERMRVVGSLLLLISSSLALMSCAQTRISSSSSSGGQDRMVEARPPFLAIARSVTATDSPLIGQTEADALQSHYDIHRAIAATASRKVIRQIDGTMWLFAGYVIGSVPESPLTYERWLHLKFADGRVAEVQEIDAIGEKAQPTNSANGAPRRR